MQSAAIISRPALPRQASSPSGSDLKKLEKLEKVETESHGRSALSQGLIFLQVAFCRQGILILVSRSESV